MTKPSDLSGEGSQNIPVRYTLGLTGVTMNAMTLMAPGAFVWLLYQVQSAGVVSGFAEIWPGVLFAFLGALLTALSFGELARRYPDAGFRSAYHFAEKVLQDQAHPHNKNLERVGKFATGWAAHLYYWVYPGVIVAFSGILADYLLRQFGYQPTIWGQVILAGGFAAFVGFLALRGITGSSTASVIVNIVQVVTLVIFSGLAIAFRIFNPLHFPTSSWTFPDINMMLFPASFDGVVFQAALAMMLMTGFEASTALGAVSKNPKQDIPRATIIVLIVQGVFVYLLEYLAIGMAYNRQITAAVESSAPVGELSKQIGDVLFSGNGFTLMLVLAFSVIAALLGSALTAINNGVRITFSMALDSEMPDLLGFLDAKYATPYWTVIAISVFSGLVGAFGLLGGLPALMGIVLTVNIGALALYTILCAMTIVSFWKDNQFKVVKHFVFPALGMIVNLGTIGIVFKVGIQQGGVIGQSVLIAFAMAGIWMLFSVAYFFRPKKS